MVVPELKISLRIKDRISDYDTLGMFLLNDETGGILEEIKQDYRFSKQRKDEIFDRWIKGEGQFGIMKSNTWGMLVKSLRDSELNALADKIESILQFCTDKSLHLDNSKCVIVNAEHTLPGQVLSVSVVTVIVVIGSAVIIIYYRTAILPVNHALANSHKGEHPITDRNHPITDSHSGEKPLQGKYTNDVHAIMRGASNLKGIESRMVIM